MQYHIYNNEENVTFVVDNENYSTFDTDILSDTSLNTSFIAFILNKVDEIQEKSGILVETILFYSKNSNIYEFTKDNFNRSKDNDYELIFLYLGDGSLNFTLSTRNVPTFPFENNVKVFETSKGNINVTFSEDESQFITQLIKVESIDQVCSVIKEIITHYLTNKIVNEDKFDNSLFKIHKNEDGRFHVNYLDQMEFDLSDAMIMPFLKKLESDPNSVELAFKTAQAIKESTSYDVVVDIPRTLECLTYLKDRYSSEFTVNILLGSDRIYDNYAGTIQVLVLQKNKTYRRLYYKDETHKVKIFTDIRSQNDSKFDMCRKTEYFTVTSVESAQQFVKDAVESMRALNRSIDLYRSDRVAKVRKQ